MSQPLSREPLFTQVTRREFTCCLSCTKLVFSVDALTVVGASGAATRQGAHCKQGVIARSQAIPNLATPGPKCRAARTESSFSAPANSPESSAVHGEATGEGRGRYLRRAKWFSRFLARNRRALHIPRLREPQTTHRTPHAAAAVEG